MGVGFGENKIELNHPSTIMNLNASKFWIMSWEKQIKWQSK